MFTIKIKTDNAAFEDCPKEEVARILRAMADSIERFGLGSGPIRDINGRELYT